MNDHPDHALKIQHVLKISQPSHESADPSPAFDPFTADSGVWGVWEDGDYVLAFGLPLPPSTLRFLARKFYTDVRQVQAASVSGQRVRLRLALQPSPTALDNLLESIKESAHKWAKIAKAGWQPPVEKKEPEFVQPSLF